MNGLRRSYGRGRRKGNAVAGNRMKGSTSMNRKIKALGLALVASFALTAVLASAASAAGTFTSSSTHTILSGTQVGNHTFTAGSGFGAIHCTIATFSGTSAATSETDQTMKPTYEGCSDSFGRTVDIDNENLTYTFTAN